MSRGTTDGLCDIAFVSPIYQLLVAKRFSLFSPIQEGRTNKTNPRQRIHPKLKPGTCFLPFFLRKSTIFYFLKMFLRSFARGLALGAIKTPPKVKLPSAYRFLSSGKTPFALQPISSSFRSLGAVRTVHDTKAKGKVKGIREVVINQVLRYFSPSLRR